MVYHNYQKFLEKNESNKNNFKALSQQGLPVNLPIYTSFSIEKVELKRGDGVVEIKSKFREAYTSESIASVVESVFNNPYVHVSNPSKIKNWRGFN